MNMDINVKEYIKSINHDALKSSDFNFCKFKYADSKDKLNNNILVLFHGLGDNPANFLNFGKKINLPQTAIVAIRAPFPIPYFDEGTAWYPSFDNYGELLTSSSPYRMQGLLKTREIISKFVEVLVNKYGYNYREIFFFGFSQGGTIALDSAIFGVKGAIGGVISISGYLLEEEKKLGIKGCQEKWKILNKSVPIFITQGTSDETITVNEAKDNAQFIKSLCGEFNHKFISGKGHTMVSSQVETRSIMEFLSKFLRIRNLKLESMSNLYEISTK
ncbi:alpha/beta-hydrolase [Anaeromyces robustus]|uniref:Alpha/beta-hydrolase n=1 Tax=Anaeromyces robustus TaxID=1754192 RepID=A0A1Y1X2I4_9FUNG|nr:alpha/beta-hydrolase [Anaeromyces robustus]|eukprot:ORX79544.1 alpha/beta-hydrolase [Anaeromyces robustus]